MYLAKKIILKVLILGLVASFFQNYFLCSKSLEDIKRKIAGEHVRCTTDKIYIYETGGAPLAVTIVTGTVLIALGAFIALAKKDADIGNIIGGIITGATGAGLIGYGIYDKTNKGDPLIILDNEGIFYSVNDKKVLWKDTDRIEVNWKNGIYYLKFISKPISFSIPQYFLPIDFQDFKDLILEYLKK